VTPAGREAGMAVTMGRRTISLLVDAHEPVSTVVAWDLGSSAPGFLLSQYARRSRTASMGWFVVDTWWK
jgi:hypothetical protein